MSTSPPVLRRILIFAEYYEPAVRAGGPVRSLRYLTDWLGDEYEFFVWTRDRDLGDKVPFANTLLEHTMSGGKARVIYRQPKILMDEVSIAFERFRPDVIYLNSFFGPMTRWLLWRRRDLGLAGVPILLAPRGEFNPGALALKRWKKRVYIGLSRFAGLPARLHFHATSEAESVEIRRLFGSSTRVKMATNFGPRNIPVLPAPSPKKKGELSLVFLSRLVPKKNLHFIFPILAKLRGQVTLKVWGPEEDVAYVRMVRECVRALPSHISVTFCGEVASMDVWARLAESHFFVLPTLGENHGHAIVEAWQAGVPVVLSDRTPWRGLEDQRLGWDLPLEEPQRWIQTLQTCLEMSQEEFQKFRTAAFNRGACSVTHPPLDDWRQMFTWALQKS